MDNPNLAINTDVTIRQFIAFSDAFDELREKKLKAPNSNLELVKIGVRTSLVYGVASEDELESVGPKAIVVLSKKIMEFYLSQINPDEEQAEDQAKN